MNVQTHKINVFYFETLVRVKSIKDLLVCRLCTFRQHNERTNNRAFHSWKPFIITTTNASHAATTKKADTGQRSGELGQQFARGHG